MNYKEEMHKLNIQIEQAEQKGSVPKELYIRQIELLKAAHEEFIQTVIKKGYDLNTNLDIMEIEIKQYSAMKQIAQKINAPIKEYEDAIFSIRVRVLGEETVKQHFPPSSK